MVNNHIYEYDSLLDTNPDIQARVAKGEVRGEIRGAQKIINDIIKFRFPTLREEAHTRVMSIHSMEMLSQLVKQIVSAKDEQIARWVLDTYTVHRNQANHV